VSAGDHLSSQFEIIHPNRAVSFGGHTYPAVHTLESEGAKAAWIPTENGGLYRVSHFGDEHGRYFIHGSRYSLTAPKERTENMRPESAAIGTAYGDEDLHNSLQSLSKVKIDPDAVNNNRQRMQFHSQYGRL
jgi:hypothetical protein